MDDDAVVDIVLFCFVFVVKGITAKIKVFKLTFAEISTL